MSDIAGNIAKILAQKPDSVELIAISKGMPAEAVRQAYSAGVRHFGENRIQEAEAKIAQLSDLSDCLWHEIGHLQTNKVRKALQLFNYIDSLDSLKLARRIDRIASELDQTAVVCLQVKLAPDPTKYGWSPKELEDAIPELLQLHRLRFRGLMTILPQGDSPEQNLELFKSLKRLQDKFRMQFPPSSLTCLSMGMSDDYPMAIQAGATEVRLGRAIFK